MNAPQQHLGARAGTVALCPTTDTQALSRHLEPTRSPNLYPADTEPLGLRGYRLTLLAPQLGNPESSTKFFEAPRHHGLVQTQVQTQVQSSSSRRTPASSVNCCRAMLLTQHTTHTHSKQQHLGCHHHASSQSWLPAGACTLPAHTLSHSLEVSSSIEHCPGQIQVSTKVSTACAAKQQEV